MRLEEFERRARQLWQRIPAEYKAGVAGLTVSREALPHPTLPDVYTLGECLTEAYPSDYGGPDTIRSVVVLYHGSFERLSRLEEEFDWEDELWETLTHELRHHLETLADEDALEALDYAVDESFKRQEGEAFDPLFYRSGERAAPGVYRVERDYYLEQEYRAGREPDAWIEFGWHGSRYHVPRPQRLGDVCFVWVEAGVDTGAAELFLVLVRRRPVWRALRGLLSPHAPEIVETEARAQPAPG